MSIFKDIAAWWGLQNSSESDSSDDVSAKPEQNYTFKDQVKTDGPYNGLWQAIEKHLEAFMVQCVVHHLRFEPNDVFKLERVQIITQDSDAADTLEKFLNEFRPDSRRRAFLDLVKRTCAKGISTDAFVDLNRDFETKDLEQSDSFLLGLQGNQNQQFEIVFYGEWQFQEKTESARPTVNEKIDVVVPISLSICDAEGSRNVTIDSLPLTIGRTSGVQRCEVKGKFVSRDHGVIGVDANGAIWFRDASVNGTFQKNIRLSSGQKHMLSPGAVLCLGAEESSNTFAECPTITLSWDDVGANGTTPIRSPIDSHANTPIRNSASTPVLNKKSSALFLLAIKDAQGSKTISVSKLPFLIGRGNNCDYRVPETNLGVSREHLLIEAIAGDEVVMSSKGTWGTSVDGQKQNDHFRVKYGQSIVLATEYDDAPSVLIQVLTP